MSNVAQLERYLNVPNVRRFLDLLAYTEGTQDNGYHTAFGGGRLSSLADHPRYLKSFRQTDGRTNKTSAAGRYQFIRGTWDSLAKQYGFKDFGARNQDLGAIALLVQNGAMPYILKGDINNAVAKAGGTWASLPSSPHPQPTKSWQKVQEFWHGQGQGQRVGTNSVLAPQGRANGGQAPRMGANTPSANLLVGIMGDYRLKDTGSGSGDHYDLRARDAKGRRVDINRYLDRFFVDGRALNTYRQTGRYMEQRNGYRHQGVDFGLNGSFGGKASARQLYVSPTFADQVTGVSSHFDKGSNGRSGGWYTKVTFKDGVSVNILHQNQRNMAQINQGWQTWQQGSQMGRGGQVQAPSPSFIQGESLRRLLPQAFQVPQSTTPQPKFVQGDGLRGLLPQLFDGLQPDTKPSSQPVPSRFIGGDDLKRLLPQIFGVGQI